MSEMALPHGTVAGRAPAKLTPTTGWPKPTRKSVPFSGLLLFTAVLFLAPQNLVPALEPLKLAKISVALALVPYVVDRVMTGRPLTMMTSTVKWALADLKGDPSWKRTMPPVEELSEKEAASLRGALSRTAYSALARRLP